MSNASITFTAKNSLVAGVTIGEEVTLNVTLIGFDETTRVEKVTNTTKSGLQRSSKFYTEKRYSMQIVDLGTVEVEGIPQGDLTTEWVEMFLRSVDNSESFFITDLDNNDAQYLVQLASESGRSRKSAAFVNRFDYSFTVRRVV